MIDFSALAANVDAFAKPGGLHLERVIGRENDRGTIKINRCPEHVKPAAVFPNAGGDQTDARQEGEARVGELVIGLRTDAACGPLRHADPSRLEEADEVLHDGQRYRISGGERWTAGGFHWYGADLIGRDDTPCGECT